MVAAIVIRVVLERNQRLSLGIDSTIFSGVVSGVGHHRAVTERALGLLPRYPLGVSRPRELVQITVDVPIISRGGLGIDRSVLLVVHSYPVDHCPVGQDRPISPSVLHCLFGRIDPFPLVIGNKGFLGIPAIVHRFGRNQRAFQARGVEGNRPRRCRGRYRFHFLARRVEDNAIAIALSCVNERCPIIVSSCTRENLHRSSVCQPYGILREIPLAIRGVLVAQKAAVAHRAFDCHALKLRRLNTREIPYLRATRFVLDQLSFREHFEIPKRRNTAHDEAFRLLRRHAPVRILSLDFGYRNLAAVGQAPLAFGLPDGWSVPLGNERVACRIPYVLL